MSIVLFVVGAIAVMVGVGMIAFGIPINEFSFGNTLIVAGATATIGGLIVVGLGAAVSQLHRIAEMLAARTPARISRPLESFEALPEAPAAAPQATRAPFPPRPRPEAAMREPLEPRVAPPPADTGERPAQSFAPTLRNPEAPPPTVDEEVSLSPSVNGSGAAQQRRQPGFEPPWRAPPPPPPPPSPPREVPGANFDAMWPAEPKPPRAPLGGEAPPAPKPEQPPPEPAAPPETAEPPAASQPRAVAILKSGVVDGMGYTLYVDGSIEAELPQGTLRFASIEELRSHLEKNP
jgi:hypothetical protein